MEYVETSTSVVEVGRIYGRYTVLGIYKKPDSYPKYALVQCSCDSPPRYVMVGLIKNGAAKSCGCYHKERVTKHGAWGTPLFAVWKGMIDRCTNTKNKRYPRYGGRGISVCERWLQFHNFNEDMSPSFVVGLTLDRVDNNGDYEPSNCKWSTRSQQNRNYSRNNLITFNGETMCIADWSIKLGIKYGTLWGRLQEGWTIERALSTPVTNKPIQ